MTFLIRSTRQAAPRFVRQLQCQQQRATFISSARMNVGKEDDLHTDTQSRKAEVEKTKEASKGKEWHSDLASNSESIVKAEREESGSTEEHLNKLKNETEEWAKGQKK